MMHWECMHAWSRLPECVAVVWWFVWCESQAWVFFLALGPAFFILIKTLIGIIQAQSETRGRNRRKCSGLDIHPTMVLYASCINHDIASSHFTLLNVVKRNKNHSMSDFRVNFQLNPASARKNNNFRSICFFKSCTYFFIVIAREFFKII